jgi:O-antigen/teichoic acid export membrane protein
MSANEEIEFEEVKKRSISGAISYFIRTIFLQAIGFGSAAILSALLSPEDFGVFGFVIQIIGILIFFSDVGLAAALVQKKTEPTEADYKSSFTIQQILSWSIVLVCLLLTTSDWVTNKIGSAGNWVLLSLAISFPLASLKTIPSIILERKLEFNKLVIPQIVEQIVFNVVLIAAAWQGYGVISYAYAIAARSVSGVITMFFVQPWKIGFGIQRSSLDLLLNFGLKFQANDLLARVKDQLFYLMLGSYLPLNQFGYIQWAKNWSMYPYNLTVQNVMAVTFPTFSRLQHNHEYLRRAIEKSLFFISLLIFPMIMGMVVFIYPIIDLIPQYAKWQPALISFVAFTLSIAWSAISTPLTNTLNAIGKIDITLRLMVMWTVLTWILTPVCMYFFGFNGVALAALIISFTSFLPIIYVKRIVPISVWDQVWRQLLASLILGLVSFLLLEATGKTWTSIAVAAVAGGFSYIAALYLIDRQKLESQVNPFVVVFLSKFKK